VQLQISDFISVQNAQNKIPFTNIGLVTLAEAQSSQTVNTASFNIPAGDDSGSVLSPTKNCIWDPNWDINPASFGLSSCNDFYNVEFDTDGHSMKPITIMDAPLTRATGRMGQYWLSLGLKLLIPRATPSGTYSSTFTFTLIYPNP
jgi:hypothetical protein